MNPARMQLARQMRCWNKSQLAKELKVAVASVTAWESGTRTPTDEKVALLARALDFPEEFFYADMGDAVPLDAASFRKLSRTPASLRDAALASGTLCVAFDRWISDRFDRPAPNLPDLDPGVISPSAAADYIRSMWELGDAPIAHVLHTLEEHGVRVYALPPHGREVDAFSFWDLASATPFIVVSTHKTPERQVFDLAHELGHLVLHRDHGAPRGREEERQADEFASGFLMPQSDLSRFAPKAPTLQDLVSAKHRWKVSVAALNYRMHSLGMISDWAYRRICVQLSQVGRLQEIEPLLREQSRALNDVLTSLRAEGVRRADIARELLIRDADLEGLLGELVVTTIEGGGERTAAPSQRPSLRIVAGD